MKIKTILPALLATLVSGQALAAQPNLYRCVGLEQDIEVVYSTSSFAGQPQFNVFKDGENLTPTHDESLDIKLTTQDSPHGTLATARVDRRHLADAPSTLYTLVVPGIQLGEAPGIEFETILLTGKSGGFRALPAVYQHIDEVETLTCAASKVFF